MVEEFRQHVESLYQRRALVTGKILPSAQVELVITRKAIDELRDTGWLKGEIMPHNHERYVPLVVRVTDGVSVGLVAKLSGEIGDRASRPISYLFKLKPEDLEALAQGDGEIADWCNITIKEEKE